MTLRTVGLPGGCKMMQRVILAEGGPGVGNIAAHLLSLQEGVTYINTKVKNSRPFAADCPVSP